MVVYRRVPGYPNPFPYFPSLRMCLLLHPGARFSLDGRLAGAQLFFHLLLEPWAPWTGSDITKSWDGRAKGPALMDTIQTLDHMNSHDSEGKANVAQKQKYQRVEGCGSLHSFKDPCWIRGWPIVHDNDSCKGIWRQRHLCFQLGHFVSTHCCKNCC